MSEDNRPELELFATDSKTKKWEPSQEIEEEIVEMTYGKLPLQMRASEAQLEEFYRIAYNMYRAGNFANALPFFHLLVLGRPQEARFVRALAATYQMLKDYPQAITYYTVSSVLDPKNPYPYYHSADCWMHMNEPIGAYTSLDMGIKTAAENPRYKGLLERMISQKRSLEKEFEEKKKLGTPFKGGTTFGAFPDDMEELGRILKS
jgi:type III secretion system low calcium response chaperone LcrH/SycD